MNPKEKLAALQQEMQTIVNGAKAAGRDLNDNEVTAIEAKSGEALDLKAAIDKSEQSAALIARIGGMKHDSDHGSVGGPLVDGAKGYTALAGVGTKAVAKNIAQNIAAKHGAKAFLEPGSITTTAPFVNQSPLELGRIPTSILEVLRTTARDTPSYRYMRQTAFTNNAAIVAPGGTKPTSVVTITAIDASLQVFAHISEAIDKYLLADNDELAKFLAGQLLYGLGRKVEDEVLSGNGTTGHLRGILSTSGIQTQAYGTDKVTTLRAAATALETAGHTADVFVINSTDWAAIETARSTSGSFDLGGPIDRAQRKVWSVPVVTTNALAAGTALALDLDALGLDVDVQGVQTDWDTTGTLFEKNQVRARVEGRFGLAVFQPVGIVKVALAAA